MLSRKIAEADARAREAADGIASAEEASLLPFLLQLLCSSRCASLISVPLSHPPSRSRKHVHGPHKST